MSDHALEAVLRRDRSIVLAALVTLTAIAWTYLLWLSGQLAATSAEMAAMPGMNMAAAMAPAIKQVTAASFFLTFVMWFVMMVGMMTPSAAPMLLTYTRVGRQAELQGKPFAATGWFATGYFLAWTAFSLLAAINQMALSKAALLTPMIASTNDLLGGAVLIAAGAFQWSRLKDECLVECQMPFVFIQRHGGFKRDAMGSIGLGFRHGIYCVACCWALMLLLFVGGVMNILWIAGLAILVLAEKFFAGQRILSRVVGAALIVGGAFFISRSYRSNYPPTTSDYGETLPFR